MKLINFNIFPPFTKIREKMEIPKNYKPDFESAKAIAKELKLTEIKTKGLDISIDELFIADNKTLEHKDFPGQKMLVYIRDFIGDYNKDLDDLNNYPRFHIAWCKTLNQMHKDKKYERYVVSQRNDGIFLLNKSVSGRIVEKDIELPLRICKNCLSALNYNNYKLNKLDIQKDDAVKNFKVHEFLETYNTEVHIEPTHTSNSQPLNEYSKDWKEISYKIRSSKGFCCEECGKSCIKDKEELQVHHIDGVKSNNRPSNLIALCINCHSNQPKHSHMKTNPKFIKYLK